jgi:hypothetical protein
MTFLIFCGHYNKARVFIFSNLHVKDAFEDSSRTMAVQSQKILLILYSAITLSVPAVSMHCSQPNRNARRSTYSHSLLLHAGWIIILSTRPINTSPHFSRCSCDMLH